MDEGEGQAWGRAEGGSEGEARIELGVDIIRVDRIRDALEEHGDRFVRRVLTDAEAAYVRRRPETFAGRWAAKEAVSKVLGLGVRGVGWREIEIERLPTGQPAVVLHGRARARADQLGMTRIAISISHERDNAIAIAHGTRTKGGRFLYPPDIEERFDAHERRLLDRARRIREMAQENAAAERALRGENPGAEREPGAGE